MNAPVPPALRDHEPGTGAVLSSVPMSSPPRVVAADQVVSDADPWVLTEETLPESSRHDLITEHLRQVLLAWADRMGRPMKIGRNLAVRWDRERPQRGVDPDLYVVEPPPPEGDDVSSLRLWEPGHVAPRLAIEIVSPTNPKKDYLFAPTKYAACGVGELWILDADLSGPRVEGGPHRLQLWRRLTGGRFERVVAGEGPGWSEAVQGWVCFAGEEAEDRCFQLCADKAGREPWPTRTDLERRAKEAERRAKEAERRAKEAERQAKEAERQAKEAALRQVEVERKAKEAALHELAALKAQLAGG